MSLAEVQQLYNILVEIDAILKGVTVKTAEVEQKIPVVKEATTSFMQLERVALRYLVIAKRLGLPEEVDSAIATLSQLIIMARMAQMAFNMLQAGTPVGIALGIASGILVAFNGYDMMRGI